MNCKNCGKPTQNPSFCSKTCSAIYTNKAYPKRKWHCKKCGKNKNRPSKHATVCLDCNSSKTHKHETLGSLRNFYKKENKHPQNVYVYVREQARRIAVSHGMNKCASCGYDLHVQIAHKKAISEFSDNVPISEINDLSNLIPLCPNCHWEFDNKMCGFDSRPKHSICVE